jgi:gamma-butyrobetaine dioxygenase
MITDELMSIYARRGSSAYYGEPVSMTEHGLQAAYLAQSAGAPDALVAAALLHDIGHLIDSVPEDIAAWNTDARHELSGSRWLAAHFGPEVCEPVRLHVAAKRYLCANDAAYFGRLSAASVVTLGLQGGPMSSAEGAAFETEAYWRQALLIRQWDDQAKIAGLRTPRLADYRMLIERLVNSAPLA